MLYDEEEEEEGGERAEGLAEGRSIVVTLR